MGGKTPNDKRELFDEYIEKCMRFRRWNDECGFADEEMIAYRESLIEKKKSSHFGKRNVCR